MRRLFWIIGAILALSLLIGGLVVVALIARTSAYQFAATETVTVGAGVLGEHTPEPIITAMAVTAQPLTLMPTSPIAHPDSPVPAASLAPTTAVVWANGQQA